MPNSAIQKQIIGSPKSSVQPALGLPIQEQKVGNASDIQRQEVALASKITEEIEKIFSNPANRDFIRSSDIRNEANEIIAKEDRVLAQLPDGTRLGVSRYFDVQRRELKEVEVSLFTEDRVSIHIRASDRKVSGSKHRPDYGVKNIFYAMNIEEIRRFFPSMMKDFSVGEKQKPIAH